jgi:DNA-directed RNA polymerase specialized sigma24 family protein
MFETSLRARLRDGDPLAFGEIFGDHSAAVYGYAVRSLGNPSTADDIVSLTFLEAWRLRERILLDGGSVRPWLLGIATNVLRNAGRTARYRAARLRRRRVRRRPRVRRCRISSWRDSFRCRVRAPVTVRIATAT